MFHYFLSKSLFCLKVIKSSGVVLDGAYLGASISVNGVCTTVVEFDETKFKV
jgi:riboflavin synthase alpha subunit